MNYKSPIELIAEQIETEIENGILRAVQRVGINIDKAELMRTLAYDRNQYTQGYHDRDSEIIRCKDCKHSCDYTDIYHDRAYKCMKNGGYHNDSWFCADGERRGS